MADYKRLVSYMYLYEEGKKKNNIGYARVETRNGQCKYTIHVTALGLNEKQLKAYVFRRKDTGIEGVLLGTLLVKNNTGDFKIITDAAHIMNSSYGMEDMGGIVLVFSERKFFATEWDGRPITMNMVAGIDRKVEKKPPKEAEKVSSPSPEQPAEMKAANLAEVLFEYAKAPKEEEEEPVLRGEHGEGDKSLKDLLTPNINILLEEEVDSDKGEEAPESLLHTEKEPVSVRGDLTEAFDDRTREEARSKAGIGYIEDEESIEQEESIENKEEIEPEENIGNKENLEQRDAENQQSIELEENIEYKENRELEENAGYRENKEQEENIAYEEDREQQENIAYEENREQEENIENEGNPVQDENIEKEAETASELGGKPVFEDHPLAKQIYHNFPKMYPFEDNEIAWCARIEPKDIGMLPMELWGLGNNSFLLHGFYSYRHLIFARVNDRTGQNYILGVPGIYHNREKFMAKMFGFENFKCAKRKPQRTGEFGYWYIPVLLNHQG